MKAQCPNQKWENYSLFNFVRNEVIKNCPCLSNLNWQIKVGWLLGLGMNIFSLQIKDYPN